MLRDDGRYLRAKPASEIVFVDDHRFACLADRFENRVAVERGQGAEIDDLDADTVRLELLGRLEAVVRHESPREAAQVGAFSSDYSRADGDQVVAVRHLFGDQAIRLFMLEEKHRVGVANG